MRNILTLLLILFWTSITQAQPPLSTISGVIYRPNGAVCALCKFDITKSRKGGVVLSTTPVPVPADINGVVAFTAVQGSIITISGNFWLGSYSFAGGKELFVPNSPTAIFSSLKSPEDTLDTLIGGGGSFENPLTFTAPLSRSVNTISLAPSGVTAGSCTNCNLTIDTFGRITAKANGSGGGGGSLTAPFLLEDDRSSTTPNDYAFTLSMAYDGDATPATQLVQLGMASRMIYGGTNPSSQGTVHTFTSTIDVQGSDAPTSEFANYMGWMKFRQGQVGRGWFGDFSLHGSVDTQQQLLNGITMLLNNYYNGDPVNAPSAAYIAVSSAGKGAGNEDTHNTQTTYPVGIGFASVGHSGEPGSAPTGVGFRTGFQAGGYASGWMISSERSWLNYGFSAQDFDTAGVLLGQPLGADRAGILFGNFSAGGTDSYLYPIDMGALDATDLNSLSARAIRLPGINSLKSGIQWGTDGTAPVLYRSANNTLRSGGKIVIDGTGLSGTILDVIAPTGINDLLFQAGSPGGTDANAFRFYNGNGDVTTFVSGGTGQFIPDTLIGDGGLRVPTGKRLFFGDTTRARLMLKESVASPTSFLVIGNAGAGDNPTLSPLAASGNVGITSTMINSGAFIIEGSNGLNDVGVLSVRRAGTTRGFNFIPSAGLSSDPHLRLASGQSWSTSFFNEADGAIASLAINASQSGSRTNATVGGIFRLDTRTGVGGLANGEQSFVIYGVPTGGDSPAVRFVSSLQDGNTLLNPNGGTTGVGVTTAATEQFAVTSLSTSRLGAAVRSAANSTVDLINWFNNVDDTNTVANLASYDSRSNGTPANGFGHSITHLLETTTTNARTAATESVFWTNATEGSQVSAIAFGTVNAGTLAERMRIVFQGIQYAPVTLANLGTPPNGTVSFCSDCVKGGNPCAVSGSGAIAQRLNNVWRCD